MAFGQIDPSRLEGDDLRRWYMRSPADIDQERQQAAAQRYQDFFGKNGSIDPEPEFDGGFQVSGSDIDPSFDVPAPTYDIDPGLGIQAPTNDIDPGFTWVSAGPNRLRSVSTATELRVPTEGSDNSAPTLDRSNARALDRNMLVLASSRGGQATQSGTAPRPTAKPEPPQIGAMSPGYRTPATPPPPTFFSWMFGGPAPITNPEGDVVGYYDHQAGKAGMGLTAEYAQIAPLFQPAGFMDGLIENGGARLLGAITDGIEEAVENHHTWAKFLGGPLNQETYALRKTLHRGLHAILHPALKEAGLLNVGGKGGATVDWLKHFDDVPGSREKAFEVLRRVYREFDRAHGTKLLEHLEKVLSDSKPPEG